MNKSLLLAGVLGMFLATESQVRPNLIFIMADDLGYSDVGAFGQTEISTPRLDRMAEEGMKFNQFYTGTPVCGPARCNLMTGLHNGHCRLRNNDVTYLRDEDVTVAEVLKYAGYVTGAFGKWGLSWDREGRYEPESYPTSQGFDRFYGYRDQRHAHNFYPEFLITDADTVELLNRRNDYWTNYNYGNVGDRGQGDADPEGEVEYAHTLIANEALEFIDNNKDTSFFLYVPFNIPHLNNEGASAPDGGYEVPDLGIYADMANWTIPMKSIAAMITLMDEDIGKILDKLVEHGIDKQTLVIFTSDNGPTFLRIGPSQLPDGTPLNSTERIVAEWFDSNGIFRGYKQDTFEGGLRMPTIAWWPGVVEAGSESDYVGYFPDILPTFADLAGVSSPTNIDGISFVNELTGNPAQQQQHDHLYWGLGADKALLQGDWKLVVERVDGNPSRTFLYNIAEDPGETTDLSGANPDVVSELTDLLNSEEGEVVVADWTPELKDPAVVPVTPAKSPENFPFQTFRNPEIFTIESTGKNLFAFKLINIKGNILMQGSYKTRHTLNFKTIPGGLHYLELTDRDGGVWVEWLLPL